MMSCSIPWSENVALVGYDFQTIQKEKKKEPCSENIELKNKDECSVFSTGYLFFRREKSIYVSCV